VERETEGRRVRYLTLINDSDSRAVTGRGGTNVHVRLPRNPAFGRAGGAPWGVVEGHRPRAFGPDPDRPSDPAVGSD
jgi:hypothetical protein